MSNNQKILILCDADGVTGPDENFASRIQGEDWKTERDVLKALKTLGHPYEIAGVFDDIEIMLEKIKSSKPDVIFNLVECFQRKSFHERNIASLFELTGIPFTGCGPTGITLCKNKGLSKEILSFHRIRVPDFLILRRKKPIHRPKSFAFPAFIKPLREEASYGISQSSFVENDEQFTERVKFIQESMNQDVIAEEYIEGRELYVSLLGTKKLEVFPIREMQFTQVPDEEPKIATYKAKWDEKYRKRWGIKNRFAEDLSPDLVKTIEKRAKKIYRLLSIHGYARIDFRLTPENEIVFLEANPNPILAEDEDFAESARKGGVEYPRLIEKLLLLSSLEE